MSYVLCLHSHSAFLLSVPVFSKLLRCLIVCYKAPFVLMTVALSGLTGVSQQARGSLGTQVRYRGCVFNMQWIRRDATPLQVKACLYLKVNFIVAALPVSLCNSDFSPELLVTLRFIPNSKVRPLAGSVCVLGLKMC